MVSKFHTVAVNAAFPGGVSQRICLGFKEAAIAEDTLRWRNRDLQRHRVPPGRQGTLVVNDAAWDLLREEASELRSMPYESGTMLDAAGNGRYARKVTVACRRERARRLHKIAPGPQDLEQLVRTDPSVLNVSVEDMERALAESRPDAGI